MLPVICTPLLDKLKEMAEGLLMKNPTDYDYLLSNDANLGIDPSMQIKDEKYVKKNNDVQQMIYIQVCWVLMWCITLSEQDKREIWFRLKQLLQVLQQLNTDN